MAIPASNDEPSVTSLPPRVRTTPVQTLEEWRALDTVADQLASKARDVIDRTGTGPLLSGTWLGHPVHPMLTDLPIGFWTSAWMLDLIPTSGTRTAARRLVGLGVLTALPAAVTGWNDWSTMTGSRRRVGLVHAGVNTAAVLTYAASWRARHRGHQVRGIALGWLGAAVATVGGYLGGHLAYGKTGDGS
jgi:uncharacterized membrane protein